MFTFGIAPKSVNFFQVKTHLYPGPLRKDCHECCFDLPTDVSGEEDVMHVYAWFQATTYHRSGGGKITVRPGQASPSVYLGSFQA